MQLADLVRQAFNLSSNSEARRQIEQGSIRLNDKVLTRDPFGEIFVENETLFLREKSGKVFALVENWK